MKVAIIGTGGVGGYFGARMAQAGHQVQFLARGKHLEAMKLNGLDVKSIKGDIKIDAVQAYDKLSDMDQADLVLVAVKAWQVKELVHGIKGLLHKKSLIIPLQNGILAAEELMEQIAPVNVLGGLCRIISKIESPGIINHFAVEPHIIFGQLDSSLNQELEPIKEAFVESGIDCRISSDIEAELWKKFIAICVSGLLAVSGSSYGMLREVPESREMMRKLLEEIYQLALHLKVNIKPDFVKKSMAFMDTFPYDSTSSLTRDVWEGKPSEIEYQNGTVVKLAKQHGLEAPVNEFVYNCILPQERKVRASKN